MDTGQTRPEDLRQSFRTMPYRYDLDGLRGIAIAFVVLFHVFVGRVSGGVDVFLLLSGYFFLGSQLRYAGREDASLNPWWPLWRTIRRLLPALLLVLGTTAVIALNFVPQLRRMEIVEQFTASLLYYQNWALVDQEADYNVASDVVSPLQHLWSMAVQGQFYLLAIILGLIVAATIKRRKSLGWAPKTARQLAGPLLIVATIASFGYAWIMQSVNQPLNYYSTWSRLWELSLGAVLVLYAGKVKLAPWLREVFTVVGLFMVLSTGIFFDGATQFPGPAALYPIGGAVLVILGGGQAARFLATRFMRWLGDIAYPLYLWHWPLLIVLLVVFEQTEVGFFLGLVTVALSLLLADLTHRFVEKPLRQRGKRPASGENRVRTALQGLAAKWAPRGRAAAGVGLAAVMVALLSVQGTWQARLQEVDGEVLDSAQYPGAMALAGAPVVDMPYKPSPELLGTMGSEIWGRDCISRFEHDPTELRFDVRGEECIFGDPAADFEVYLTGGSHADHWIAALDALGKEHSFRIIPLVRQSCPTFASEQDGGLFAEDCQQFNEQVIERLAEVQPDLVITTTTRPPIERGVAREELPTSYVTYWQFLADQQIPFLGLRDNPWKVDENGVELSIPLCVEDIGDIYDCGVSYDEFYLPEDPAAPFLDPQPNMKAVDTSPWFCIDGQCPAVIGNIFVYRDGNHLSNAYVSTLAPLLWEEMREFLPQ